MFAYVAGRYVCDACWALLRRLGTLTTSMVDPARRAGEPRLPEVVERADGRPGSRVVGDPASDIWIGEEG